MSAYKENTIIVHTSSGSRTVTALADYFVTYDGKEEKIRGKTSQFTMALMSVLDGTNDLSVAEIGDVMKPEYSVFPNKCQLFGPNNGALISHILRKPSGFRWYGFQCRIFCRKFGQKATRKLSAITSCCLRKFVAVRRETSSSTSTVERNRHWQEIAAVDKRSCSTLKFDQPKPEVSWFRRNELSPGQIGTSNDAPAERLASCSGIDLVTLSHGICLAPGFALVKHFERETFIILNSTSS